MRGGVKKLGNQLFVISKYSKQSVKCLYFVYSIVSSVVLFLARSNSASHQVYVLLIDSRGTEHRNDVAKMVWYDVAIATD